MTFYEYKQTSTEPLLDGLDPFKDLLPSDERDYYEMYMPSIQLFSAKTEASFTFTKSRLTSVSLAFSDYADTATAVSSKIIPALKERFHIVEQKDSKEIPGAYSIKFNDGPVDAFLWVNLTDSKKPIVQLFLSDNIFDIDRQRRIKQREQSAFGGTKK